MAQEINEQFDASKSNVETYSICIAHLPVIFQFIANYYGQKTKFTAKEITALVHLTFAHHQIDVTAYDAKTTFCPQDKKLQEVNELQNAVMVFDCKNNINAQYLEQCLATIGFWTSKGSGRQSDENSKYVYIVLKMDEELKFRNEVGELANSILYNPSQYLKP